MDEKKCHELLNRAKKYGDFMSGVSSDEFNEFLYEHLKGRLEEGFLKKVEEELIKSLKGDGCKVEVVKLTEDKVPREMLGLARQCYWQGYLIGLNVGKHIALEGVDWLIRYKLAEIDHDGGSSDIKYLKVLLYFFKDRDRVNETERAIMRLLQEKGLSYREIAKITGRSLDTIHRHLKVED